MALSKSQIATELAARSLGGKQQITNILNGLADLAAEEIADGEDFIVPGIASLKWAHTSALTKGQKYKKGDEYVGFGGITQTAEADSKPRKAAVKLRAAAAPAIKRLGPTKATAAAFMKSKTAKAVVRRKAK